MKIINYIFSGILVTFIVFIIFQDYYGIVPLSSWLSYLTNDYIYLGDQFFNTSYTINITLFITLIGIIIAIISIIISKINITMTAYIKHFISLNLEGIAIVNATLSFLFTILCSYFRYTLIIDLWLKLSIVYPIILALTITKGLSRIEDKDHIFKIMITHLINNDKFVFSYFKLIFLPVFRNEIFSQLSSVIESCRKYKGIDNNKLFDNIALFNDEITRQSI